MSSIKCPSCGLVNFASSQFCKRCNQSLAQAQNIQPNNETQIFNQTFHTSVRQTQPVAPPNHQNGQQNNYGNQPPQNFGSQPVNYQNQPPNYAQNSYTLPRFPEDERPPEFRQNVGQNFGQSYGQNYGQAYGQNYAPNYQQNAYYPQPVRPPDFPIRRMGTTIVLNKNADLPCSCVKCGKDLPSTYEGGYSTQKFRWHNPLLYIALISPLIYLILALCVSERFSLNIPLCHEHLGSHGTAKNYLLGGGIAGAVLMIIAFNAGFAGFGFLLLLFLFIGIPLIYEYGCKSLRVKKIEGSHYYLDGASNEYLKKLPY